MMRADRGDFILGNKAAPSAVAQNRLDVLEARREASFRVAWSGACLPNTQACPSCRNPARGLVSGCCRFALSQGKDRPTVVEPPSGGGGHSFHTFRAVFGRPFFWPGNLCVYAL